MSYTLPHNLTSAADDVAYRRDLLLEIGPVLFGALVNWLLLGVLTVQIYVYHLCFPRDYWWIKFSAYGLYLLDIGQTVLVTENAWAALCAGWGIPSALLYVNWGFSMNPLVSGLTACWIQIFFAWRVWALGHNTFWKSVVVVISVVSFAQGCAAVVLSVKLSFVGYVNGRVEALAATTDLYLFYLSANAFCETLIAASVLYFLITTKRMTAWSKVTDRRITKLIRTTFETGVLSAAIAFLELILLIRTVFVQFSIVMVLSKLYSNALMASLNSRAGVYERPTTSDSPEETRTTHLNAAQFTSVGIPVTTGGFERESTGRSDKQSVEWEYVETGRARASVVFDLTNLGRV